MIDDNEFEFERDTIEDEDVSNITALVILPASVLMNCSMFGMHFNKAVFDGWVKQPSPCCGAAAVAGAWNSVQNIHRRSTNALSHMDVVKVGSYL